MTATAQAISSANRAFQYGRDHGSVRGWVLRIGGALRALGPYLAIELVLPGGSLLALLLWLYRRQKKAAAAEGVFSRAGRDTPAQVA